MGEIGKYRDTVRGYTNLTQEDAAMIHEGSLEILETVGVRIPGKEAHEILGGAGCEIDEETNVVKFPHQLVVDCIETCPDEFTLYARDERHNVHVKSGEGEPRYLNFGTGVEVVDLFSGEVRSSTKEDIANLARFIDGLDEIDIFHVPVSACDVDPYYKDLHEGEACLNNTTKHLVHHNNCGKNTRRWIEMLSAVTGGKDKLREKPIATMVVCPNSPLEITEHAAEIMIESARAGLPVNTLSMGLCGGTTPVTIAGTLVVTNAEFLAGMTLVQLVNHGNPMIYGSSTTIMDMITSTTPVGSPEIAMIGAGVAAMGHFYSIPGYAGGS